MGMQMELNTMIVTKNNEMREEENLFTLVKEGYRLYPMEIPIEVRVTKHSESNAIGRIEELRWKDGETSITYRLLSLNSTN
ncbi:DUF2584 domain-containing protein [Bacillus sp. JRC01]|nr:DUF2584 domain-containing protein [Bacillus sp. JRC01]